MAQLQAASSPRTEQSTTTSARTHDDPRWRNDASFTLLVASLLLMVLTLMFWVS